MKLPIRRSGEVRRKPRIRRKPKIHWQQLGLTSPKEEKAATSMDEIRRQVVMMSGPELN